MWDLHAEEKNRNQSCQKNSDFPMIFFTFMTVRRHCRSRSAADCTFTIIHAEEWNLIWSISGWAPPMDCKKRYNELDAGTREVNGEINPNAQTESDKTSFFYYNISDFLVFYIYIYSYIFIYMLILQLRRKIWNKCWFNIRVYKKKSASFFLTDTNVLKSFSKDQLKVKGQLRGSEGTAAWAMIQQRGRGRR